MMVCTYLGTLPCSPHDGEEDFAELSLVPDLV